MKNEDFIMKYSDDIRGLNSSNYIFIKHRKKQTLSN